MLIVLGVLLGVEVAMNLERIFPIAPDWQAVTPQN